MCIFLKYDIGLFTSREKVSMFILLLLFLNYYYYYYIIIAHPTRRLNVDSLIPLYRMWLRFTECHSQNLDRPTNLVCI